MMKPLTALLFAAAYLARYAAGQTAGPATGQATDANGLPLGEHHILGVVPDYNTLNGRPAAPMTVKGKFKLATDDSFDPFSWVVTGLYAGVSQWQNKNPTFGQGAAGYGKRYGATFADQFLSNYMSEAILPVLLHEDPRFFRLGLGTKWKRAGYAFTRIVVTRTDSGRNRFNTSEIAGNLISASLSNIYYPPRDRNATQTFEKFATNVLSDAGFNVLKEFWPDMRRKVLKR